MNTAATSSSYPQIQPTKHNTEGVFEDLKEVQRRAGYISADAMKGKGELRIRTMREGEDVLVEFVDSGPGIPPEIQTRIFDPFFTTKPMGEGTGLGLDTVYRIVRKHHGNISLVSRPGNTCFRVRLPIQNKRI